MRARGQPAVAASIFYMHGWVALHVMGKGYHVGV